MNKIAIASSIRSSQLILGSSADHTNVLQRPIDHCIHRIIHRIVHRIVYRCIQTNACYPIYQFINFISRHNFSKVCVRSSQILWLLGCLKKSSGIFEIVATVTVSPQDGRDNLKDSRTFLGFLTAGCKTSFPSHSAPAWLNISLTLARCGAVTGKRSFTLP